MRYTLLLLTLLAAPPTFAAELNEPTVGPTDEWLWHSYQQLVREAGGEAPVCVYYDQDTAQFIDPRSERGKEMKLLGEPCHDDYEFYQ